MSSKLHKALKLEAKLAKHCFKNMVLRATEPGTSAFLDHKCEVITKYRFKPQKRRVPK